MIPFDLQSSGDVRQKFEKNTTHVKWKTPFPGTMGNWSKPIQCPPAFAIFGFRVRSNHLWFTAAEFRCADVKLAKADGGKRKEVKTISLKIEDQPDYYSAIVLNEGSWGFWEECPGVEFATSVKSRYNMVIKAERHYGVLPGVHFLILACENGKFLSSWDWVALDRTVGYVYDSNAADCGHHAANNYISGVVMKYDLEDLLDFDFLTGKYSYNPPTAVNSFAIACQDDYSYYNLEETEMRYLPEIPNSKAQFLCCYIYQLFLTAVWNGHLNSQILSS